MTSTPDGRTPDDDTRTGAGDEEAAATGQGAGAELGVTEGEGSTFEPEEDPEAQG